MIPAKYLNPRTGAEWSVNEPLWERTGHFFHVDGSMDGSRTAENGLT